MKSQRLQRRSYRGDADLQVMLDALSRAHAGSGNTRVIHPGDLVWAFFQNTEFDPLQSVELWESEDGGLVGFGVFEGTDFDTQCFTDTVELRHAFESEALEVARERALAAGDATLSTYIHESDALRKDLLAAKGFAVDEQRVTRRGEPNTTMLYLRQSLEGAEAAPLPSGFVVRGVGGAEEWSERVELHRTVWAPSRVTLEAYQRLRAAPVYRPDLDLVAVAPNGRFASYAIVWYDPAARVGEFEPVGTHPDFRRQGAGRAVMREGLRRLRALGARRALVMSSAHNPASIHLYESVGFEIADRESFYQARV